MSSAGAFTFPCGRSKAGTDMAKKSRMAHLKRYRERRKAEKVELKRQRRAQRQENGGDIATADDLQGYGLGPDAEEEADQ